MRPGRDHGWDDFVGPPSDQLAAPELDPETPLMVIYTSGTTGKPKGAVHVHGGFLVKIAEECAFQTRRRTRRPVHVGDGHRLDHGPAKVVVAPGRSARRWCISEGAPDYPGPDRLWQQVERHRITRPRRLPDPDPRARRPTATRRARRHDRSSLRILASTGEAWNPEPYRWLHHVVGEGRRPIINLSGGTEVGACFLSPMPVMPLKECTLGAPALGMAMDVVDADGNHLPAGSVGELVCRKPWPSMTRGVWGDPERYLAAYWSRWPGIWVHGDWASVDEDGYWYLHGRSDDTLNIAGKRIGPAEFESAAVAHPARRRGLRDGHAGRGEGRGGLAVLRAAARVRAGRRAARRGVRAVTSVLGKAFAPSRVEFVPAHRPHLPSDAR